MQCNHTRVESILLRNKGEKVRFPASIHPPPGKKNSTEEEQDQCDNDDDDDDDKRKEEKKGCT